MDSTSRSMPRVNSQYVPSFQQDASYLPPDDYYSLRSQHYHSSPDYANYFSNPEDSYATYDVNGSATYPYPYFEQHHYPHASEHRNHSPGCGDTRHGQEMEHRKVSWQNKGRSNRRPCPRSTMTRPISEDSPLRQNLKRKRKPNSGKNRTNAAEAYYQVHYDQGNESQRILNYESQNSANNNLIGERQDVELRNMLLKRNGCENKSLNMPDLIKGQEASFVPRSVKETDLLTQNFPNSTNSEVQNSMENCCVTQLFNELGQEVILFLDNQQLQSGVDLSSNEVQSDNSATQAVIDHQSDELKTASAFENGPICFMSDINDFSSEEIVRTSSKECFDNQKADNNQGIICNQNQEANAAEASTTKNEQNGACSNINDGASDGNVDKSSHVVTEKAAQAQENTYLNKERNTEKEYQFQSSETLNNLQNEYFWKILQQIQYENRGVKDQSIWHTFRVMLDDIAGATLLSLYKTFDTMIKNENFNKRGLEKRKKPLQVKLPFPKKE